mgnify:FL=1
MNSFKISNKLFCTFTPIKLDSDPTKILLKLRKLFPELKIQLLNSDSIINQDHLIWAVKQTYEAQNRKILLAKKFEIDLLLRLSITSQINEAIKLIGALSSEQNLIVLSLGNKNQLNRFNLWIENNFKILPLIHYGNKKEILKKLNINYSISNFSKKDLPLLLLSHSALIFTDKTSK